jgi:hypothetical protein
VQLGRSILATLASMYAMLLNVCTCTSPDSNAARRPRGPGHTGPGRVWSAPGLSLSPGLRARRISGPAAHPRALVVPWRTPAQVIWRDNFQDEESSVIGVALLGRARQASWATVSLSGGTRRRAWPTEAGEKEAVFSATLIMLGLT